MAKNLFRSFFPVVKASDEDLIDPQQVLREKCAGEGHTTSLWNRYQECNDRVNGKSKTTENCAEELFDYIAELDHCVGKTLWSKMK